MATKPSLESVALHAREVLLGLGELLGKACGLGSQVDEVTHADEDLERAVGHGDAALRLLGVGGSDERSNVAHGAHEAPLIGENRRVLGAAPHADIELGARRETVAGTRGAHAGDDALGELEVLLGALVHELGEALGLRPVRPP